MVRDELSVLSAFMSEERAAPHLASGELVRVLEDWCPPFPGFFLYYPTPGNGSYRRHSRRSSRR